MKGIAAGRLRHQVTVQKPRTDATPGDQVDSLGQPVDDWPAVYSGVWASIESLSQQEIWQAQQQKIQASVKITMRYRAMSARYRIVYADPGTGTTRYFQVTGSFDPTGERVFVTCLCQERGS